MGAAREVDHLVGVARKIPDRGIDLSKGNLHISSLRQGG